MIFFHNADAYLRQSIEESLADDFIQSLIERAKQPKIQGMEEAQTSVQACPVNENGAEQAAAASETENTAVIGEDGVIRMGFEDNSYYERDGISYTPDYAVGDLICVLEYPRVGIRRGVYTGTWDEIYADLDMWMVTLAHPEMAPGQTHLAIYGHNHTAQNLSFNRLNQAAVGDQFYLYADSGVYTYEVVDIFADWRTDTTKKYVDDFTIGSEICYIITCGRDHFLVDGESTRYKDFIVEGHLIAYRSLTEQ